LTHWRPIAVEIGSYDIINMFGNVRCQCLLLAAAILATGLTASLDAHAQFFWDQQYQYKRSRPQSGGFFRNFFEPFNSRPREDEYYSPPPRRQQQQHAQPAESSRAPSPRKPESKIATSIVVMGDDMADWLAYGLENVFADSPEIGIVRKNKLNSGLVRYDSKSDLDWWHVARDTLAQEKADYVIMMLGIGDRQDIGEKDLAKEAEAKAKDQQVKDEADKKTGQKPAKPDNSAKPDNTDEAAAAVQRVKKGGGPAEFRGDEWAKVYSRRIDETISALKSKGVPVIWVGLPSIRGARSTSDVAYLNDLYRSRAERAGITYIDVWDGFVDEAGKYSNYGPDYEGQVRRLRLTDGVFFTKSGAIKLARYVDHELRRFMNNRVPVALPSGPVEPSPSGTKPAERPLVGPVVPLTGTPKDKDTKDTKDGDDLLGGPGSSQIHGDATATKVLAKGEAVAAPSGRADSFSCPNGNNTPAAQSLPAAPVAAETAVPPAAAGAMASAPPDAKPDEGKKKSATGKVTQKVTKRPTKPDNATRQPQQSSQDFFPRPPMPIGPANGPFFRTR
jgi:hypothetical protein